MQRRRPTPSVPRVPTFLIQRTFAFADVADLGVELAAVRAAALAMTAIGQAVRVVHATYVPGDQSCLCVVDAEDAATVVEALRRAGTGAARILPALAL